MRQNKRNSSRSSKEASAASTVHVVSNNQSVSNVLENDLSEKLIEQGVSSTKV